MKKLQGVVSLSPSIRWILSREAATVEDRFRVYTNGSMQAAGRKGRRGVEPAQRAIKAQGSRPQYQHHFWTAV